MQFRRLALQKGLDVLENFVQLPSVWHRKGLHASRDGVKRSAADMLGYPDITLSRIIETFPELREHINPIAEDVIASECSYLEPLRRQRRDMELFKKEENLELPDDINYRELGHLSMEEKEKLIQHRPKNLGAASRIEGITPASLVFLLKYVRNKDPDRTVRGGVF